MKTYTDRLNATKAHYPFDSWLARGEELEQYTEEICGEAAQIFDRLIAKLSALGEGAMEPAKVLLFKDAVQALNELDEKNYHMIIESEEAGQLCALCDAIAVAANIDPKGYGSGEGIASEWRDW